MPERGGAGRGVRIEPLQAAHVAPCRGLDGGFTVDARLRLRLDGDTIAYRVEPVAPYGKRYRTDPGWDPAPWLAANPDAAMFVALDYGEVAGYVMLSRDWTGLAQVDDLCVDRGRRRRGIGRALVAHAVDWARARSLPGIRLETQDVNVAACRLYAACGFVLHGFDRRLYAVDPAARSETALFWYRFFDGAGEAAGAHAGTPAA